MPEALDTAPPNATIGDSVIPPSGWRPPISRTSALVAGSLILAGLLVVLFAWRLPPFSSSTQTTDNAYVRGQVTILAPQVSGYVTATPVTDFQTVAAGQVLARIDDRIYRQRLEQAGAGLAAGLRPRFGVSCRRRHGPLTRPGACRAGSRS